MNSVQIQDNYPSILSINMFQFLFALVLSLGVPGGARYISTIYSDVRLIRRRKSTVKGWRHKASPYQKLRLRTLEDPTNKQLDNTHHHITFANEWFTVGEWSAAERHYKNAIDISIKSNNIDAALMAGTNLALCYLAARDNDSALLLTEHILDIPIDWFHTTTFQRVSTIRRLLFVRSKAYYNLALEVNRYSAATSKLYSYSGVQGVDYEVNTRVVEAYLYNGQTDNLNKWEGEWNELETIHSNLDSLKTDQYTSQNIPGFDAPKKKNSSRHVFTGRRPDDITSYKTTTEMFKSGMFSAEERKREYRKRGKSPSGVIDGVYNDMNLEDGASYNDMDRDWDADA